ncbi:MAG: CinA family protein [Burkholderiales bacterium]|nr:MAG: CinA family protein [Burkholderiales bacterium]
MTADDADRLSDVVDAAVGLGHALRACGWMIATAESCTGGAIARALTETGGSSTWFERGFVTYSDQAKIDLLGVSADTLAAAGAVSPAVAAQMADGALTRSRAQLSLAVTGIAGPGGATPGKPVGTVCFGWAAIDAAPVTETRRFAGDRAAVRRAAALHALRRARELLAGWVGAPEDPPTTNS